MLTLKQEDELLEKVRALSELELESFLEKLKDHVAKNNLVTAVQIALDITADDEEQDELRDEVSKLEDKIQELEDERDELQGKLDKISGIL